MSEIKAIDIEELGSTIKRGLVGIEVQIANLNTTMKELIAIKKGEQNE
tara:strand:- start:400 stop:543 length:144 start_codon:yes stop_codon:yes gene_type:complete